MTTHMSLQMRHEFQDLSKLGEALEFPVARLWKSGDKCRSPNGDLLGGCYEESYLALKIKPPSKSIPEAIELIRIAFAKVPVELLPIINDPTLRKILYCTIESGAEELRLPEIKVLFDLGIELGFD
ncbi:hypothetical protein AVAK2825_02715 [Acidovorax sp. SUPP2825]|nr:hypothetical protein AVAK2825_02715 [Acidovorax sp. SUPP2825]